MKKKKTKKRKETRNGFERGWFTFIFFRRIPAITILYLCGSPFRNWINWRISLGLLVFVKSPARWSQEINIGGVEYHVRKNLRREFGASLLSCGYQTYRQILEHLVGSFLGFLNQDQQLSQHCMFLRVSIGLASVLSLCFPCGPAFKKNPTMSWNVLPFVCPLNSCILVRTLPRCVLAMVFYEWKLPGSRRYFLFCNQLLSGWQCYKFVVLRSWNFLTSSDYSFAIGCLDGQLYGLFGCFQDCTDCTTFENLTIIGEFQCHEAQVNQAQSFFYYCGEVKNVRYLGFLILPFALCILFIILGLFYRYPFRKLYSFYKKHKKKRLRELH